MMWSDEYSVGVEVIDEQHKHFFDIASRISQDALKPSLTKEGLEGLLGELGDYALYHLDTEEKYFDTLHYEEADAHKKAHDEFRETVGAYLEQIKDKDDEGARKFAQDIALYAADWLKAHILTVDKRYTKFFHEHGLS